MSENNNLKARYNGVFSNSIFKTKGNNQDLNIAFETEKTDGEKYLVFNNLSQDMFGEYDGEFKNHKYNFASAIDFMCKEKLLGIEKVNRFKRSASELNNVLTKKNNYDTREKIFDAVNKARIAYLDLMNVLKEISDELKGKQIKPDQKNIEKSKTVSAEVKKMIKETTEMLIDYQLGILMTNKVFFIDLGSRLCDALEHGDKFQDVSLDGILRNPTENTKVYYVDQKPDDSNDNFDRKPSFGLESFGSGKIEGTSLSDDDTLDRKPGKLKKLGSGAVSSTYLFDNNSKVLKFGDIFLDTLSLAYTDDYNPSAVFNQEKAMGNINAELFSALRDDFKAEIKKLSENVFSENKNDELKTFFNGIAGDGSFWALVLTCVHALDNPGNEEEFMNLSITHRRIYFGLFSYYKCVPVREALKKMKPIVNKLSNKYGVLVNTAFRENIAYELASMLGFKAIVKTQTGITPKDYVTIMDKIKGKSFDKHFYNKKNVETEVTKDYIESVMELMAIDYLLAQSDRHTGNYFFDKVTETLVGIDNDYILSTEKSQKETLDEYNNLSTKLPVVTERIKNSILSLGEKDFEGLLEFSLMDKKLAVNQAKERLNDLKNYVKNVKVVDIDKDKDRYKIIDMFVNPVKQFEQQKQISNFMADLWRRMYGNPIYSNVEVFKNNMKVIKKAKEKDNDAHIDDNLNNSHKNGIKDKDEGAK